MVAPDPPQHRLRRFADAYVRSFLLWPHAIISGSISREAFGWIIGRRSSSPK